MCSANHLIIQTEQLNIQSLNHVDTYLKPQFLIKSGYYILPSPSTNLICTLLFLNLYFQWQECLWQVKPFDQFYSTIDNIQDLKFRLGIKTKVKLKISLGWTLEQKYNSWWYYLIDNSCALLFKGLYGIFYPFWLWLPSPKKLCFTNYLWC
jgi:hypothetical protein